MFWKKDKPKSLLFKLSASYCIAFLMMLSFITITLYPALKDVFIHAQKSNQTTTLLLTGICLNKLFISLWLGSLLAIIISLFIAKRSLIYIAKYSKEISQINENALSQRIHADDYPKELDGLSKTCNSMLSRIDNKMMQLKAYSASMAHELKNPIHLLQTTTEVTLRQSTDIKDYQKLLESHLEEYHHLSKLIDDLLFLSRADTQKLPLNIKKYTSTKLISSILDYYQYAADEKNITISCKGTIELKVDLPLFKRVIANILDNAIKFTQPFGKIDIIFEENKEQKSITIRDNGCGIDEKDLPYLSDGFYQAHKDKSPTNKGVGLGLMIAKAIIHQHQGKFDIESHLNKGTTVTIFL